MKHIRAFTLTTLLSLSIKTFGASSTLNIQGVTYTLKRLTDKSYSLTVLSNNPNGFSVTVTANNAPPQILSVPSQNETKTYQYKLNFTSAPQYVTVTLSGD
jgi:thiamine pyrophosphokinase